MLAVSVPSAVLVVLLTWGFTSLSGSARALATLAAILAAAVGMMWAAAWLLVKPQLRSATRLRTAVLVAARSWRCRSGRCRRFGPRGGGAHRLLLDDRRGSVKLVLLYLLLLKATATSFSGLSSLPVLREDLVVRHGLLTDRQLNVAVTAGRSGPGPNGLYVVSVGYLVAGVPGACAGLAGDGDAGVSCDSAGLPSWAPARIAQGSGAPFAPRRQRVPACWWRPRFRSRAGH